MEKLEGDFCVLVDNVYDLKEDDVENMCSLVDLCNAKKNLHLLVIAYYAKKNIPSKLYGKFRHIKFLVPTANERLKLLKEFLNKRILADDMNEKFLRDFTGSLSHFTARDIAGLVFLASVIFFEEDEGSEQVILSKRHFEKALERYKKNVKEMEFLFEECE